MRFTRPRGDRGSSNSALYTGQAKRQLPQEEQRSVISLMCWQEFLGVMGVVGIMGSMGGMGVVGVAWVIGAPVGGQVVF